MPNNTLLPNAEWPYLEILVRLALNLALGLLIGLERERRGKEAGLRTFGFICLLGALGGSLGNEFALLILLLVGVLAVLLNVQTLRANQGTELTTSAAALLLILAPLALVSSLGGFALMLFACVGLVLLSYRRRGPPTDAADSARIALALPFSLPQALKYGAVFLVLHIVGGLTQREFGDVGFYFVSVIGGLMSSASAVAAAATLASQGSLSPTVAGTGAVLASFTSIAFSLSFVLRTRETVLIRQLAFAMALVALAGVIGVLAGGTLEPIVQGWIPHLERPAR